MTSVALVADRRGDHSAPAAERPSLAALVAGTCALVSVGTAAASVVLHAHAVAVLSVPVALAHADLLLAVAFPIVAATIVVHQRENRVGWLVLTTSLTGPYLLAGQYAALSTHSPLSGGAFAAWLSTWAYQPYLVLWGLVPMHFPDGRLPSRRWRTVSVGIVALLVISTVARMLAPVPADVSPAVTNPVGLRSAQWLNVVTLGCSFLIVFGGGLAGVVAVTVRLRQAEGVLRRRLQWLVFGVAWLVVTNVFGVVVGGGGSDAFFVTGMAGLVIAIAVGAIRHQLFDVGTALSRTIVYVTLTGLLLIAVVAAIDASGAVTAGGKLVPAAITIVALIAAAARDQLQAVVDRVLFGQAHDSYTVLTSLRRRLDLASGPADVLAELARGVQDALKLPYVGIEAVDPRIGHVAVGNVVGRTESIPATDRGDTLGHVVVGRRAPRDRFTRRERRALADVAARAGELLRTAELSHEVQRHRQRLVLAREEERRRLRRDLHDGVGPTLAAVAMQLDQIAVRIDSGDVDASLAEKAGRARDHLRATVASVRHIVEDLRPPALDELGLVSAIGRLAAEYAPIVRLDCDQLPTLPAATEVAAYRIASEALTNAMRHSGCASCVVRLAVTDQWLVVSVVDDGCGLPAEVAPGVGLSSIRDRVSELGGRLDVRSEAGTTVQALLPLAAG